MSCSCPERWAYGVMMPQTPMGCMTVMTVVLGVDDGIVSPYDRVASSANHEMKLAAYRTSPSASANVLPFSRQSIVATEQRKQISILLRGQISGDITYDLSRWQQWPRTTSAAAHLFGWQLLSGRTFSGPPTHF